MKVLLIAAELAPLAPAGGVAQYLMGLARALKADGQDVKIAIPAYGFQGADPDGLLHGIPVERVPAGDYFGTVRSARDIYRSSTFEPWMNFSRAVVSSLKKSPWVPDVIHCHDGHASLIPVLVAEERKLSDQFRRSGTILTIHNLLEQGNFSKEEFDATDLPEELFWSHFEYYGKASCYKAGLIAADRVSTVSATYAREIVSSENFGFGLAGVLRSLAKRPAGIVNGIDGTSWNMLGLQYDGSDSVEGLVERKLATRAEILPQWSVPAGDPIICFKGRWDHQKGIELMIQSMETILESACFVFDTWGEPKNGKAPHWGLWQELKRLEARYPLRLAVNVPGTTSPTESAVLYTLADFLLMPSVYEPCGLAQMECQRYGCVPIVRRTGGLADTVRDERDDPDAANGVVFNTLTAHGLLEAMARAAAMYRDKSCMKSVIGNTLRQENGWEKRVAEYTNLYAETLRRLP
jgi:starch synthase